MQSKMHRYVGVGVDVVQLQWILLAQRDPRSHNTQSDQRLTCTNQATSLTRPDLEGSDKQEQQEPELIAWSLRKFSEGLICATHHGDCDDYFEAPNGY